MSPKIPLVDPTVRSPERVHVHFSPRCILADRLLVITVRSPERVHVHSPPPLYLGGSLTCTGPWQSSRGRFPAIEREGVFTLETARIYIGSEASFVKKKFGGCLASRGRFPAMEKEGVFTLETTSG